MPEGLISYVTFLDDPGLLHKTSNPQASGLRLHLVVVYHSMVPLLLAFPFCVSAL